MPAPFARGRPISGLRTRAPGTGHIVLHAQQTQDLLGFFADVLGVALSDYMRAPCAYFFHVTARHPSFAMIETRKTGLHHLLLEMVSLDDVGRGYDLAAHTAGPSAPRAGTNERLL